MSAKEKKEPAAAEEASKDAPKKKLPMKMIIVALSVVLLEGGTVALTAMMSGGPKRAPAEVPTTAPAEAVMKYVELPILKAKLPNNSAGHMFLYDIQVVAKVSEKNKEKASGLLTEHAAEIQDRIRTIIASSDKKTLDEPGLETLRRQIGYQMEKDIGEDVIKELLIPQCTPWRGEF